MTSRYSANVACDFSTITCALTPSTLSRNCCWNPVVTASTIVSAATPSATPSTDTLVNTVNTASSANTAAEIMPSTSISTPNGRRPVRGQHDDEPGDADERRRPRAYSSIDAIVLTAVEVAPTDAELVRRAADIARDKHDERDHDSGDQ